MKDQSVLEHLKKGDNEVLKAVYLNYKSEFINFALQFNLTKDEAVDVYQDCVLAFRENIATGKLQVLKSSLKTYLFSIGKYMIYEYLRSKKRYVDSNVILNKDVDNETYEVVFQEDINANEQCLKTAFVSLGEKCKNVLTMFYYQGTSIDEITQELNYKNKDVVKSQKSRCLKILKEKLNNGR